MTKKIVMSFKRQRIYVWLLDNRLLRICLPGDLLDITDKFSEKEKRTIEKRALTKALIEKGFSIIGGIQ